MSVALLVLGVLLVIASAFLPWLRYSIRHNADNTVSNTTYSVWGLSGGALFPACVWFPLAILVWALARRFVGSNRTPSGHVRLMVLCVLGAVGVLGVTALGEFGIGFAGIGWGSRANVTPFWVYLPGMWLCLGGYALLIAGLLLLGREPASGVATRTAPSGGNSRSTLFVPRSDPDPHRA